MNKTIKFFYEISQIPRESGNEEHIANYLCEFAEKRNLFYKKDQYNNVIIKKKTSNSEPIILQAHIDMVCEKDENKVIDFSNDPIEVYEEEGYLKANGTTLGADNGIGVAQILNILDSDIKANIEAIFTTSEETTMTGAENINVKDLNGKRLICLDGFEEDTILLESASFFDIILETNYKYQQISSNKIIKIKLNGLEGGHSGFDINKNKGNAIQELSKVLINIKDIQLASFSGGTKFNVIPSSAEAIFYTNESRENVKKLFKKFLDKEKINYKNINIEYKEEEKKYTFLNNIDSINFLNAVLDFKHGVIFENDNKEVTSSINLGVVNLKEQIFKIGMRSSKKQEEKLVIEYIQDYAKSNQFKYILLSSQPGFETKKDSKLVQLMQKAFKEIDSKTNLKLKTVHITVESGFFKEKIPNLDVAIISPKILGAHTINERVEIKSIQKCDLWLQKILENIS